MQLNSSLSWLLWAGLTLAAAGALGFKLLRPETDRSIFLPGPTSHGHYQIELSCQSCHSEDFTSQAALQSACEQCHAAELKAAHDSHPKSKFQDPRNADRVKALDARQCITCHVEHRPDMEQGMGLTLQRDYCWRCHQEIADERPSHRGMAFDSCASAGCHNFHDNRALYEDFLDKRADEPDLLEPARDQVVLSAVAADAPAGVLPADLPEDFSLPAAEQNAWAHDAHGRGEVGCGKCHQSDAGWSRNVSVERCAECHAAQAKGWLTGRHGMRVAQKLSPMLPELARLPMKKDSHGHALDCNSCHGAHDYDTRRAAFEACIGCHDDEHSRNYSESSHYELWQRELSGQAPAGSGVSCATCHLPRVQGDEGNYVEHNQNDNLRPSEKMIRTACNRCHGVRFAIDALADPALLRNNFSSAPSIHIASVDMARDRARHIQ